MIAKQELTLSGALQSKKQTQNPQTTGVTKTINEQQQNRHLRTDRYANFVGYFDCFCL